MCLQSHGARGGVALALTEACGHHSKTCCSAWSGFALQTGCLAQKAQLPSPPRRAWAPAKQYLSPRSCPGKRHLEQRICPLPSSRLWLSLRLALAAEGCCLRNQRRSTLILRRPWRLLRCCSRRYSACQANAAAQPADIMKHEARPRGRRPTSELACGDQQRPTNARSRPRLS